MKTQIKENYVVPQMDAMELISENFICDSFDSIDALRQDYGEPITGDEFIW